MASCTELDIDSIARIGLLFLDGDSLENVLLDRYGHTDYDFDCFNRCKAVLLKMERINPRLGLTAILWQRRPDNLELAVPVVAGNALPVEGYRAAVAPPSLRAAFSGEYGAAFQRDGGCASRYYPVQNSDAEIVGVLELLSGQRVRNDI